MTRSSPKRPLLQPGPELANDVSTGDLSGLAQTAEFELRGSASQPAIDARSRYQILERLGAGGFGVVFKAWDAELERAVAIKLVRPRAVGNSTPDLLAEGRTLARPRPSGDRAGL